MRNIFIFFVLCLNSCTQNIEGAYFEVSASALKIRSSTNHKTDENVICQVPHGAVVQVVEMTESQEKINGIDDYWVKVRTLDTVGFVFKGYLILSKTQNLYHDFTDDSFENFRTRFYTEPDFQQSRITFPLFLRGEGPCEDCPVTCPDCVDEYLSKRQWNKKFQSLTSRFNVKCTHSQDIPNPPCVFETIEKSNDYIIEDFDTTPCTECCRNTPILFLFKKINKKWRLAMISYG